MHRAIIILGPTAAGKSDLAVRLARRFHGVIISADSRQVYRRMNIGTGKITRREMRGVRHELLDVASPRGQYSISRYVRDVRRALRDIPDSTPIFVVGGSPNYLRAVIDPNSFSPVAPDPMLRRKLERASLRQLVQRLRRLDPKRLKTIDQHNPRRLIRAIEIALANTPSGDLRPPVFSSVLKIGLTLPRPELYRRIDRRVDSRLRQGMIREVQKLHDHGVSWKRLDAFGLEYRYVSRHLRGQLTRTQAIDTLKGAIHDFARRQLTWWRKEKDIHWIGRPPEAVKLIRKFL